MNPSIIIESELANFRHLKVAQMCIIITILGHEFPTNLGTHYLDKVL